MANNFKRPEQREHWNKYNNEYSKKNYRTITIKLNLVKDKDIIDYLESSKNGDTATGVIRTLVKEKLANSK